MKLHIHAGGVDEIVEVKDAAEALRRSKSEAAKRAPFLLRPVVNAMSDLTFAAEAVKRHNAEHKRNDALPDSAEAFLQWAIERKYVSVVE